MLDKSICHFSCVRSVLSLLFYLKWKILLANIVDPDYVASDLGLHCLPMTLLWISRLEWVKTHYQAALEGAV